MLIGVSLGLALALAEGGLVVAGRYPPEPRWFPGDHVSSTTMSGSGVFDETVGWKLQPGEVLDATSDFEVSYSIGPDGWRSTSNEGDEAARFTAVFVGDSFTFGTGVEDDETFVSLLGETPDWRALNFGMSGFGVDQMWQTLVHAGLEQQPKLVVASFVLDDLDRSMTAYRYRNGWIPKPTFVIEDGELVPRGPEHAPGKLVRWFERSTRLGGLWRRAASKLELATGFGERWALNRALFEAMRDATRRQGAELVVVFIPYRQAWEPTPMLAEAFAELEVLFLDLGAEPVEEPLELFFAEDPHFNAEGHRYTAERLAAFLADVGLFPPVD